MILYITLITTLNIGTFILKITMDTAIGLIQINIPEDTGIKQNQLQSSIINNTQQKPIQESSLEILETQTQDDYLVEHSENNLEELNQSNNLLEAVDVPWEQKVELAYKVQEIKQAFEDKDISLESVIGKLKDIMDNAYKMSPKDTPYDDYETRLKAIQTWAKLLQLGKPQQVYNVLNMRGKPPQIN